MNLAKRKTPINSRMNLLGKGAPASDKNLPTFKSTFLNPNAAAFVPFALRSSSENTSTTDSPSRPVTSSYSTFGKAVLERPETSVSNNSDDEACQHWQHQLPDDITPDFKVLGKDESLGINNNSFLSLSLNDVNKTSRFSVSPDSGLWLKGQQGLSAHNISGNRSAERMRYPVASYIDEASAASFHQHLPTKPWDNQFINNDQLPANSMGGPLRNGSSRHGFVADMPTVQPYSDYADINPLPVLASQFPGLSAESLAEMYCATGGDLNLTIEILTQLELQFDSDLNKNLSSKALSDPNLSALDFPALSAADGQTGMEKFSGHGLQHHLHSHQPSSMGGVLFKSSSYVPTRGTIDFASTVRIMAPHDSDMWKYDRNGSPNSNVKSSRSSQGLAGSYSSGQDKGLFGDGFQPRGHCVPVWLETGEVVANMYSEMREGARGHARLHNAYFEQAWQAYLIGNKALAKELSVKGQLHNLQMKAAHGKAQESIFCRRNPVSPEMQASSRGQGRIIDLHGVHVSEAIHVLKRELAALRNVARSTGQRMQAYICVGTGHHTRGSRMPATLPNAVQQYLLEEEGLHYSEPQPGLLRVNILNQEGKRF